MDIFPSRRSFLSGSAALLIVPALASARDKPPPQVQLIILNSRDLAASRVGQLGADLLGLFLDVNGRAEQAVADGIGAKLQADGIQATITRANTPLSATYGVVWASDTGQWLVVPVPAGTYRVLFIEILNYEEVAKRERGRFTVGLGKALGVNIASKVHEEAAMQIHRGLIENGVEAVLMMR